MGTPSNTESSLIQRIDAQKERMDQYESSQVPAIVRDEIVRFVEETSREWKVSQTYVLSRLDVSRSTFYHWKTRLGTSRPVSNGPKHNELHPVEKAAIIKIYERLGFLSAKRLALMMSDENIMFVAPRTMHQYLESEGIPKQCKRNVGRLFLNLGSAGAANEKWIVNNLPITGMTQTSFLVFVVDVYSGMILDWILTPFKNDGSEDPESYIEDYMEEFAISLRHRWSEPFAKIEKRIDPILTYEALVELFRIAAQFWDLVPKALSNHYSDISTTARNKIREYMERDLSPAKEEQRTRPELIRWWDHSIGDVLHMAIRFYNNSLLQSALGYFTPRTVYEGTTSIVNEIRNSKLQANRKGRTFDWESIRYMLNDDPQEYALPEQEEDEGEEEDENLHEAELEEDPAQLRFRF